MQIDFYQDLAKLYKSALNSKGVDESELNRSSTDEIILSYIKIYQSSLKKTKRSIMSSKNLFVPDEIKENLMQFERIAKDGEDLNAFLSKQSINPQFNDNMLNDWGIYHFHLGEYTGKSNFVKRTSLLLYAFVTDECIYEICIKKHGEWSNQQLIEAIHQEWPHLLEPFYCSLSDINYHIASSEDIKKQRKLNQNYVLTLSDGTKLLPSGGGFAIDGTSDHASDIFIYIKHEIQRLERMSKEHYKKYDSNSKIQLIINGSGVYATVANNSREKLPLNVHEELKYFFQL